MHTNDKIELNIYCDEIYDVEDKDGAKWMYIGALFVPLQHKDELLGILNNCRCIKHNDWHDSESECPHKCGFHSRNDSEVHSKKLSDNAKLRVAENWINFVHKKACSKHKKMLYFNILGINLTKMDLQQFGSGSAIDQNLYNRFYRTVLLGGLNYFFKGLDICINEIYHDRGAQESHDIFSWHTIRKIHEESDRIKIASDEVTFIDSDHRKSNSNDSHFIQLIDTILGATYFCLHKNENPNKKKLGFKFKPVMEILVDRNRNPNGKGWIGKYYKENCFYRTYQVSFFPKREILKSDIISCLNIYGEKTNDSDENPFYFNRPIVVTDPHAKDLNNWFEV